MKNELVITGWHETSMKAENAEESLQEMIFQAARGALEKAGMSRDEIGTVIVASCDVVDGVSISNVYSVGPSGAFLKDESKIEADGGFALYYAMLRLLSGIFDSALVVAWGKGSNFSRFHYWWTQWEPFFTRPLKLSQAEVLALQAKAFSRKTGFSESDAAKVLEKNLRNAAANGNVVRTWKESRRM